MGEHCDDALEKLYLYLDGEMSSTTARVLHDHLDDCPPCYDVFAFEERLKIVVRTRLSEEVPVEVIERLRLVIRSERRG